MTRREAKAKGLDLHTVLEMNDLAKGDNTFFACTGITDGELVRGVHYSNGYATTESLVMRSRTGTIRRVVAQHRIDKIRAVLVFRSVSDEALNHEGAKSRRNTDEERIISRSHPVFAPSCLRSSTFDLKGVSRWTWD